MSTRAHDRIDEGGVDKSLVRWMLKQVGNPNLAVRLWDGEEFTLGDAAPVALVEFRSRRAILDVLRSPSIAFGENYSRGQIEVEGDFLAFMNEITTAILANAGDNYRRAKLRSRLYSLRGNTLARSQHNVHHHYDLGNDFYKLWLDERMVYTCAYYETAAISIADAQVAKLDHVCRKLRLKPGQKVIEAGCGWGALALHMAEHYGVEVKAWNSSREQVALARERAAASGLDKRVTFVEDDYRNIDESCDVFVSVGMLEHVGMAHFETLGRLVGRVLNKDGVGLIHSIGRSHPQKMDPWILKHIFPGGHAPALSEMMAIFEPLKFSILDIENLRPHYARTCADWFRNFEKVSERVAEMYSEEFARMWRLYLAGSAAGFSAGTLQLYQVLFVPESNRNVPLTRRYQYADAPDA